MSILNSHIRLLFILGLSVTVLNIRGQEGSTQVVKNGRRNYCIVHVDKPFYVTGEVIWFKTYLPETLQYRRSLARVDLVDHKREVLHSYYTKINKQKNASGYYLIPYNLRPDIYYLTVTVFDEDGNFPYTLAHHPIAIYNDLMKLDTTALNFVESGVNPVGKENANQNTSVEILTDQSIYRPRQEIKLTIKVTDKQGRPVQADLSVSVADDNLVNYHPKNLDNFSKGSTIERSFLVDNEVAFRGTVKTISDNSAYESDYLGALIREEGLLRIFESYDDGTFEIDLPYFEGPRQMQLLGYFEPNIHMDLDKTIQFPENLASMELVYTREILNYLELSRERKKINQLFDQLAFQSLPYLQPPENRLSPDRMLDLSLYEPFESMQEFFKQVVTPLKIKKKKDGSYDIKMVNPDDKPFYNGVPRFIIDGYFIDDPETAVTLEMKSISRIELFYFARNLMRQFDQFGNSGIVAIYTKEGDFFDANSKRPNTFKIHGGVPVADFPAISNAATDSEQNRPVFRPVIYWNPSVSTNQNGEAEVSFFHSDDKGTFRIEVLGDVGNGEIVTKKKKYEIK